MNAMNRDQTIERNRVVIFGNGQMAEIAHVYLTFDSPFEVAAFCVDEDHLQSDMYRGLSVVSFQDVVKTYPPSEYAMFVPIGAKKLNRLRTEKYLQAKGKGYQLISYVSPKALVAPETKIGENCFIFENNVIQPFATIGNNVILWSGNHVGHHSAIMDNCFVASHVVISGNVTIEPYCYFGVNATVRDGITIGESCVIGAGALIMKSTSRNQVFKGQATECASFSSHSAKVF